MPPEEFEPAVAASEWPHSHTSDCAVTGLGHLRLSEQSNVRCRPRNSQMYAVGRATVKCTL